MNPPTPTFAETRLTEERFRALLTEISTRPKTERWTEIPWKTELNDARTLAAQAGKPLLLWIMDGHPLGCT